MSQPKLTLRPPPHREFIQGFPGIAASGNRPAAHVAGTIEVRLGTKGLKAAWLRIELRKLETLPGGESWGELIGKGPIDVWTARRDESHKAEAEKGWELLQTADFPFQVPIPEGLPPSAKLDKQAGITYELVTSLCVRSKKGLIRKETTSTVIQNTHPVWVDKHELHSLWPVYFTPEDHEAVQDDLRVKVLRSQSCFGLGDSVDVTVIVSSNRVSPAKIKSVACFVRETVTYKGSAKKSFSSSSKGASQKTENLSAKSRNVGKKIYKGDSHTFDLACQIPRNHTLMTIETAKHIEVSYALRVVVETGKKPIVIDHLPITVSNFTKAASEAMIRRIGYVAGLSASNNSMTFDETSIALPPTSDGAPTITRAMSYGGSTYSGRTAYPGYVGGDLRRKDTIMTQGTNVSGPGMAGRGVPGQVFSWGQYGSAQPFAAANPPPRPAFAGPSSIYDGFDPVAEERFPLSISRPQSSMGHGYDPNFIPAASYSGHSGGVTPIMERSQDGHYSGNSPQTAYANLGNGMIHRPEGQRSVSNPAYRHSMQAIPSQQQVPAQSLPTSRIIPSQQHRQSLSAVPVAEATSGLADVNSAEGEKERLYERARQQAERNQRRADERRAHNQSASQASISTPVNEGRPFSMVNTSTPGSTAPPVAQVGLSAEAEKARLYERARLEAEQYQKSFQGGAAFPAGNAVEASSSQSSLTSADRSRSSAAYWTESNNRSAVAGTPNTSAPSPIVSGKPAPYQSYMTTEEEKRLLYERAKAEAEEYQRSEGGSGSQLLQSSAGTSAPIASPLAAATIAPASEKEQLKRYYEARDAVAQNTVVPSNSGYQHVDDPMYTPEVASAVHHATPHQPADTVPTPPRTTPSGIRGTSSPFAPAFGAAADRRDLRLDTAMQSYLTESEQQSAIEKERLASHFARKTANADARAAAKSEAAAAKSASPAVGSSAAALVPVKPAAEYAYSNGNSIQPTAGSEKAQLAAYYAAKDAVESNTGISAQGSSAATHVAEMRTASPATFAPPTMRAVTGDDTDSIYTYSNVQTDEQRQFRPRYASLYDDDDSTHGPEIGGSTAPPPLPPKTPLSRLSIAHVH